MHYALDRNPIASEGDTVRYQIDPRGSTFKVRAFATGLLSAFGHSPTISVRDFSGEAQFNPETLGSALLQLRVRAGSLVVADDIGDKDRRAIEQQMYEEVLETAEHAEIVYATQSVAINKGANGQLDVTLEGELTLRGVTQPQRVSARVIMIGDTVRASGQFSLSQSAYGIQPVSAAAGTIKLKDELKGTFDILARKIA